MSKRPVEKREFASLEDKFEFYRQHRDLLREEFPADRFLCYIASLLSSLPAYVRGDEIYILRYGFGINLQDLVRMRTLPPKVIKGLWRAVDKMKDGMSVERMFSKVFFYGHDLMIKNGVLCPRPETELVVERVIERVQRSDKMKAHLKSFYPRSPEPYFYMPKSEWEVQNPAIPYVLDMCTGSGCIGVSVAKACPYAYVTLSDISLKALDNARCNIHLLDVTGNARINRAGDMFEKIEGRFDVIVCNPPYIKSGDLPHLSCQVLDYDPLSALDGGKDGLVFYRRIASSAVHHLRQGGVVIMEIGYNQARSVGEIFETGGYEVEAISDYGGKDRIIIATPKVYEEENGL